MGRYKTRTKTRRIGIHKLADELGNKQSVRSKLLIA